MYTQWDNNKNDNVGYTTTSFHTPSFNVASSNTLVKTRLVQSFGKENVLKIIQAITGQQANDAVIDKSICILIPCCDFIYTYIAITLYH